MSKFAFDPYSPLNQRVIDGLISATALWFAYEAAFNGQIPPAAASQMWGLLLKVVLGRIAMNEILRCYRMIWRYVCLRDLVTLACSYVGFSVVLMTLRYAVPGSVLQIPVGVVVVELLFSFTGAAGARVTRRILHEVRAKRPNGSQATRVLLIRRWTRWSKHCKSIAICADLRPVAFLDDDPRNSV
jgi:FlaA1/EpsC-like NDP-sugar epimerase